MATKSDNDDEGGRRAARYVTRIANMFRGGEDTAVVLSALTSITAIVLQDVGVDVDSFTVALRQSYDRLVELKKANRS